MRGVAGTPVVRMTIDVTSEPFDKHGRIAYTMRIPDDVHIPGASRSLVHDLRRAGAYCSRFDHATYSLGVVLGPAIKLSRALETVAEYLRWLHDFGGGVEFKLRCPLCGNEESFVL